MKQKVQLNQRVRPQFKQAAKFSAGVIGVSVDELGELMVRVMVGDEDASLKKSHEKVVRAWRAVGEKLPFNVPPVLRLAAI